MSGDSPDFQGKLRELIEDYRSIVTDKYAKLSEDEIAKQDIIDYVKSLSDKRVGEAYGKGYNEGYGKGYNFAKDDEEKASGA